MEYLNKQNLVAQLSIYAYQTKQIRQRPYLISEAYELMKDQLEALIIRYAVGEEGFYPVYLRNDKTVKKAVELIQAGKASPQAIKEKKYLEK